MALQSQKLSISLSEGVDTKTDPKQVVAGKLITLENATFESPKRIQKRNGNTALATTIQTGGNISAGKAGAVYNQELIEIDGTNLYSRSTATSKWVNKGAIQSISTAETSVIKNSYYQVNQDSAYHSSGLVLSVWDDSRGTSRYSIYDSNNKLFLVQDASVGANTAQPKSFTLGSNFLIFYWNASAGKLQYVAIATGTPTTLGSPVDVATNMNTIGFFDTTAGNSRIYIAYVNTTNFNVAVLYIDSSLVLSSVITVAEAGAVLALNICYDSTGGEAWVSYYNSTSVKTFVRNSDLTSKLAATVIETLANVTGVAGSASGGSGVVYYEYTYIVASSTFLGVRKNTITDAGVVGTSAVFLYACALISKAFTQGGVQYLVVGFPSSTDATYYLVNSTGKVVAKFAPHTAGGQTSPVVGISAACRPLCEINGVDSNNFVFCGLQMNESNAGVLAPSLLGVTAFTINFSQSYPYINTALGNNLLLSGSMPFIYDGGNVVEQGFNHSPLIIQAHAIAKGAFTALAVGTYQYTAVFEWIDNQGQIHRSTPSVPASVVIGVNQIGEVTVGCISLTNKTAVLIVLYRTDTNGTPIYKVASAQNVSSGTSLVFTDAVPTGAGSTEIYTDGGVVDNDALPPTGFVFNSQNRVIAIPTDNPRTWWFSKIVVPGSPLEFSLNFVNATDIHGQDLVSGGQLDDKMILFTADYVAVITGTGPADTGAQNDYSDPIILPTGTGCTDPKSVVSFPGGLLYKSKKGIYLLDRSLSSRYIGADVEAHNSYTVLASQLITSKNQVIFLLSSGNALVYDYHVGQWSVFTNFTANDLVIYQDKIHLIQSGGTVLQETPGVYTDNGAFIKLKMVTSWLSFAGLQGFQRVRRLMVLGDYKSAHSLVVKAAYDFVSSFTQTTTIPLSADPAPYQLEIHLTQQKCEAIQISIEDTQSPAYGEGFSLSALAFEVGVKGSLNRVPNSKSFG